MNGNRELNGQKIESLTDEQVRKSGGAQAYSPIHIGTSMIWARCWSTLMALNG